MTAAIAVVGSLNRDVVFSVRRLPQPGETVAAASRREYWGGKGANQAVAAARLGGSVAMVGAVGSDAVGADYLEALAREHVGSASVVQVAEPTGEAFIMVEESGENAIVIDAGANGSLTSEHVLAARDTLESATVTLLQFEVPIDTVETAAKASKGTVVLNPAPFRPALPRLLDEIDLIVPNETELAGLTGVDPDSDLDDLAIAARSLGKPAVVTLGARGCLVVENKAVTSIDAHSVVVADTTAGGDAFCGGLAVALTEGANLVEAARFANAAGAASVTEAGAQSSLPSRETVEALLT